MSADRFAFAQSALQTTAGLRHFEMPFTTWREIDTPGFKRRTVERFRHAGGGHPVKSGCEADSKDGRHMLRDDRGRAVGRKV